MSGTTWIVVGVAFAACCVWLTVRIVNRSEKWAKWTAVAVLLLATYPISFGPAFCLVQHGVLPDGSLDRVYFPFVAVVANPRTEQSSIASIVYNYPRLCEGWRAFDRATDRYCLRRNAGK